VGSLYTAGTAAVIVAAITGLTRITIVRLALRGDQAARPARDSQATAGLWAPKRIELRKPSRRTDAGEQRRQPGLSPE
jgi:hypothetical protein